MENLSTVEYKPTLKDRFRWNLIQPVKDWNHNRKSGGEKFSLTYGEWQLLQVLINWRGT